MLMTVLLVLAIGLAPKATAYLKSANTYNHYEYPRNLWKTVSVRCGAEPMKDSLPPGTLVLHWITPGMTTIPVTYHGSEYAIDDNGWILNITKFVQSHYGDYICALQDPAYKYHYRRIQLFKYIPTSSELYKSNAIVGCIAAAVALGLCIVGCLFYHFKYDRNATHPPPPPDYEYNVAAASKNSGYENHGQAFNESEVPPRKRIESTDGEAVTQM